MPRSNGNTARKSRRHHKAMHSGRKGKGHSRKRKAISRS